jgi:hypothetical protein
MAGELVYKSYNDLFKAQFGVDTTGAVTGVPNQIYNYGQAKILGPVEVHGSVSLDETFGSYLTVYNEALAVPASVETTVVTYAVPTGKRFVLLGCSASSDGDARFRLYIGSTRYATKRNNWCERNVDFINKIAPIDEGVTITVKIIHACLTARNFEASIYGSVSDIPVP